jgi:predicted transcriptional regulator
MTEITPIAISEKQAARMLGVSAAALRRWRRERRGPDFLKLERCIRYRLTDLNQFLNENVVSGTRPSSVGLSEGAK